MTAIRTSEIEEKNIGRIINQRYKLIEKVGVGGMGNVYLAEHEILKKKVAVKILHYEQSKRKDTVERFKREAIAASNMGQANIVDVTDFGYTEEGNAYFVMEYIEGQSLSDIIRDKKVLPLEYVVSVASQICVALYSAHGKGIIHRDLKPENVLITEVNGVYPFVKIVDFGISKILHDEISKKDKPKTLTKSGAIFGTPEYMSPEQAGGNDVGPTSDIYSLGVMMYEMLTGQLPFIDDNYMKVLHKHQYEFPELPSIRNTAITSDVDALVMKCLEKKSFNRYETMLSLLSDLKKIYIGHKLEKKISLAFLFNSGTVSKGGTREVVGGEDSISGQEIIRLLNSEVAADEYEMPHSGSKTALKATVIIFLLFVAGLLTYGYVQKKKKPLVVYRDNSTVSESPDDDAEVENLHKKNKMKKAVKKKRPKKNRNQPNIYKPKKMIELKVKSNIEGVRVYDKDTGKTICITPCSKRIPKDEAGVLLLGFEMDDFDIKPMAITLDRDMVVNLKLNTTGG